MRRRDTAVVLQKARQVYGLAQFALSDLASDDPRRRIPGLWNAITYGRNVTFVLQNLRTINAEGFNAWYAPREDAMRADPLLQYFNKLRSVIEKEGGPEVSLDFTFNFDSETMEQSRPPGNAVAFVGDALGGAGWIVELPDGSTEKYYVVLPDPIITELQLRLPDPPSSHLGLPISDTPARHLCALYLAYIGTILVEAEAYFPGAFEGL